MLGVLLACVVVAWFARRLAEPALDRLRYAVIGFCLLNWLGWDTWQLAYGIWSPVYSLPLHLCTLSVPLAAVMLVTRNRILFEILYFWGFTAAVIAMLTPDLVGNGYGFPHFRYWIFFTSHGAILLAVVFAANAFDYRPTWRSVVRVVIITNLYLIVVGMVNWITGGNYVYVARKPEFASPIDLLGPWPWYIIPLQLIGAAAFVLAYLPYAVRDRLYRPEALTR